MTEDAMVGWHHQLDGQEFEQAPEVNGQGSLVCCSPCDYQESSSAPQFKSINSSALSFLCSPALTSIHDYWKNHSSLKVYSVADSAMPLAANPAWNSGPHHLHVQISELGVGWEPRSGFSRLEALLEQKGLVPQLLTLCLSPLPPLTSLWVSPTKM